MSKIVNSFTGEYNWLSNFSNHPFKDEIGMHWKTVEHYFQAFKAKNEIDYAMIMRCESPGKARRLGSKIKMRGDWEKIKIQIMLRGLRFKFGQNKELIYKLLDTYDSELVEGNYWHDNFWGNCNCEKCLSIEGKNTLGRMLMHIRKEYHNAGIYN